MESLDGRERDDLDDAAHVNAAWELAAYFLELGDDISVTALRALLN
jgi:hypothetical protein